MNLVRVQSDAHQLLALLQKHQSVGRQQAIISLGLGGEWRLGPALRYIRQDLGPKAGIPVLAAARRLEIAHRIEQFLNGTRQERSYNATRVASAFGNLQAAAKKFPSDARIEYAAKCYRIARLQLINARRTDQPMSDAQIIAEISHFLSVPITTPVTAHMVETWKEPIYK
jgi:hypothetical protein